MKSSKNIFSWGAKIFALTFAVTSSTIFIVWAASGASTVIGTNISTNGTLTVGGLAALNGFISSASSTVSSSLLVSGPFTASSTATSTFANGINLFGGCFAVNGACLGGGSGTINAGVAGQVAFYSANGTSLSATSSLFFATSSNSLGIGTTTPGALLAIQGNSLVSGTSTVGGLFATGTIQATNLSLSGGSLISGASIFSSTLLISSLTTTSGLLSTASSSINANLSVSGPISASSSLSVLGQTVLGFASGTQVTLTQGGYVTGGNFQIGTTSAGTSTALAIQGNSLTTGTSTVGGLFATGTIQATDLSLSGNASTSGSITVSSSSATSTFSWGISTRLLKVTSTTATSTFSNGIDLANGCFSINGICVGGGGGSGTVNSGTIGQVTFYGATGTTVSGTSSITILADGIIIGAASTSMVANLNVAGPISASSSISVAGNINLKDTTALFGQITQNGRRLIHNFDGTASSNLFVGDLAGNFTLGGGATNNVGVGNDVMLNLTSGAANTGVGSGALTNLTTGGSNVAMGWLTLSALTTGIENTAIGKQANLGLNTANYNTSVGTSALGNSTGDGNTGVGRWAGLTIQAGTNNTFLGKGSDASATDLTKSTAIGYNAIVASSSAIVLGGTGVDAVRVGVGTTSPYTTFAVDGKVTFAGLTSNSGDAICIAGNKEITYNSGSTSCVASSQRYKHDIESLGADYGLKVVNALRPVSFKRNSDNKEHIGLIAEEVLTVEPRLVAFNGDGIPNSVHYEELTSALIKAIQELYVKSNFMNNLTLWLTNLKEFFVEKLTTKKLCLEDICIEKAQLQEILLRSGVSSSVSLPTVIDSSSSSSISLWQTASSTDPVVVASSSVITLEPSATSTNEVASTTNS